MAGFSFFANKNITTGEGGMVVTNDKDVYDRARYFKNVCFPLNGPRNYQHEDIGFNYRMSNVVAAIGLAQVEKADEYRQMRIRNHQLYRKYLADVPGIIFQSEPSDNCIDVCWMNTIVLDPVKYGHTKDELILHLKEHQIDTRLLFTGMHKQKAMIDFGCDCSGEYPVCEWLTENGFYLPSSSGLTETTIKEICDIIASYSK
jgi:perosamine synthetase